MCVCVCVSDSITFVDAGVTDSHKFAGHDTYARMFVAAYDDSPVIIGVVGISQT